MTRSGRITATILALLAATAGSGFAQAQNVEAPPTRSAAARESAELMRTRFLNRLTNQRAEEYLARNDLIFVAVGPTEMHGGFPLDAETVLAEAITLKMAEKVDTLALGGLPFIYAGATAIGRGTVQLGARESSDLIHSVAHSLNRQGFGRQVYVAFHGPSHYLITPALRDFFDETLSSALLIDLTKVVFDDPSVLQNKSFYSLYVAAYDILGRIEDVPLTTADHDHSVPSPGSLSFATDTLNSLAPQSSALGYYFGKPSDHGVTPRMETPEARQRLADDGVEIMDAIIEKLDLPKVVQLMRELDTFQQEEVVPRYGDHLPGVYNQEYR